MNLKNLKQFEQFAVLAIIFLLPLVFAPISPNLFIPAKLAVLFFGLLAVVLSKTIRIALTGKIKVATGRFDIPVLGIAIAYIASTIWAAPSKMEALLLPGTTTYVFGGVVLYFLVMQLPTKFKELIPKLIGLSAGISALVLLLAYSTMFSNATFLPGYLRSKFFNLEGAYLSVAAFFAVSLPFLFTHFIKEQPLGKRIFVGAKLALVGLALAIVVISMFGISQGGRLRLPALRTSWSIAIDSLQNNALLGVGPSNYQSAFNRYRPIAYNQTDLWNVKFGTTNALLTTVTETGLLGLISLVFLFVAIVRLFQAEMTRKTDEGSLVVSSEPRVLLFALILSLTTFVFLPASIVSTVLLFILLALNTQNEKLEVNLASQTQKGLPVTKKHAGNIVTLAISLPVIVGVLFLLLKGGQVIATEYKFARAIDAVAKGDGQKAYSLIAEAINRQPRIGRYRASFAQLNLLFAGNITQNPTGENGEFTEADRTNISQLIQQAIAHGKAAVAGNPTRSENWELLAGIYQAIIPLAEGADAFAAQAMIQAIALDPLNTNLRVAYGGLLYSRGAYNEAVEALRLAVATKGDHANSHYNLAYAYKESGDLPSAVNEMSVVLSLINPNSPDYETVKKALEDLQAEAETGKETPEAQGGQELNPPQPSPEAVLEPPLELPEDAAPPEGEEIVEAQETASPGPTPTPLP